VPARVPLVLLPALLCDAELYRPQTDALPEADVRVVAAAEPTLARSADVVLARAPARFALGGTSAGGNLALEVLAAAPDRVAGLWLSGCNPGAHGDAPGARRLSERARAGEFDEVVDELAARCIHAAGPHAAAARATLEAMARRVGCEVFLRQHQAVIDRADRTEVVASLAVPTLLLWGRHDRFAPPERADALVVGAARARVVVLEDCGHLPTLEQPEAATLAVRAWLRAVAATLAT
jgi:pimeloyl-ACP methyl ester carboxylesterase